MGCGRITFSVIVMDYKGYDITVYPWISLLEFTIWCFTMLLIKGAKTMFIIVFTMLLIVATIIYIVFTKIGSILERL